MRGTDLGCDSTRRNLEDSMSDDEDAQELSNLLSRSACNYPDMCAVGDSRGE